MGKFVRLREWYNADWNGNIRLMDPLFTKPEKASYVACATLESKKQVLITEDWISEAAVHAYFGHLKKWDGESWNLKIAFRTLKRSA